MALPSWGDDSSPGCPPAPRASWGPAGNCCIPPAERPVGWQGRSLTAGCGLCHPSVRLSESWEGSWPPGLPWCLIHGSLPPQLDEEEERRKRRREKNKVAAARCRNKKKERTEFLQRVRRAVARVGPALSFRGLCAGSPGDSIPGLRNQCMLTGISPGGHDLSVPTHPSYPVPPP